MACIDVISRRALLLLFVLNFSSAWYIRAPQHLSRRWPHQSTVQSVAPEISTGANAGKNATDEWFERVSRKSALSPVVDLLSNTRLKGKDALTRVETPRRKLEPWRYTDLTSMFGTDYCRPQGLGDVSRETIEPYLEKSASVQMVFMDGVFCESLSDMSTLGSLSMGGLSSLTPDVLPKVLQALEKVPETDPTPDRRTCQGSAAFGSLNQACLSDCAYIFVPEGVEVERPIQVLFMSSATLAPSISHTQLVVVVESGASASLLQSYAGVGDGDTYFTNALTTVELGAGATLKHAYAQEAKLGAQHIETMTVNTGGDSIYELTAVCSGSRQSRFNFDSYMNGENALVDTVSVLLSGGVGSRQVNDFHSSITHNAVNAFSKQKHRNMVSTKGECIFKGRIAVPQVAQGTDSEQLCRTLLLTDDAKVVMMPSLEIVADQVKCEHGATVSDLSGEELFYLLSRGIDRTAAKGILARGFLTEVIRDRLDAYPQTSSRLDQSIKEVIPEDDGLERSVEYEYSSV